MKHSLGIMADCITGEDVLVTLERIKKVGFDTVFVSSSSVDRSVEIKQKADELGLITEFIHAPFKGINDMWANDDSVPEILTQIKHTVDVAAEAGVPVIILHVSSGWKSPEICDKGLARFDEVIDYAEEKGVVVALENLRRVGNISYLVDRYEDRSCVRFCYDSGHEHGYTVYASFPDIFRDRIICTHIHDNLGLEHNPENPDLHLLPFEGNINYKDMMKRLHKYSYKGPLSLEVWTGKRYADRDPDEFLRDCYKRIKKISKL